MRAMEKALVVLLSLSPMSSFADWAYSEHVDEMRGEKAVSATISSEKPISPQISQAKLTITSVRSASGNAFFLDLENAQFSCSPPLCDVSMKFDNGKVLELKAAPGKDSNNTLYVQGPNQFVATAKLASRLIVEVPVYKQGKSQFKFDVSGLTWDGETPSADGLYAGVGGQSWAAPYNPATGLVDSGFGEGDDRCYIDAHPATLEFGVKPTKITHCYYQGRHYSSMVDFEFSKLNQVVRAVSKQVGKPELELKEYVSWSEIEEKNLLSIGILGSKKSNVATLLVTYVPADNLVPPRKLVTQ